MTVLTAYNKDVQRFFQGNYSSKVRKETIISAIEERVFEMGKSFSKLFPRKKALVLDEIIFLLSGKGICKIGSEKLAEKVGCSIRTVRAAVASIKETDQILVARLADKKAGKYIFVYKEHPNFKQILNEVFFIDSLPESMNSAQPIAPPFAPLQNSETLEAVRPNALKTSSNHINFFNSKQEKESIQEIIENSLHNSVQNPEKTRELLKQYHANEFQLMLFDQIMDFPFPASIKKIAGVLSLRVGVDCEAKRVLQALQMLKKIALNMQDGVEIHNVAAVFSEGMRNERYRKPENQLPTNPSTTTPKVKFFNWLT